MGTVHAAADTVSGRGIALKVMNPALAAEPAFRWRFKQEFWLLSRLGHPGIVAAYDLGQTEDALPYFTMERVAAPPSEAADTASPGALDAFVVGVLRLLAYLHGAGYFHGDLKPDNCRLLPDGHVKLLDFGLAEPIGTIREAIRGTLEYLAPEAASGQALDGRVDLYALGCTIYALVSGEPPFRHSNPWRLLQAHATETPAPLEASGTPLARRWGQIVARLLAKRPQDRFPSASSVLEAVGADPGALDQGLLEGPLVGLAAPLSRVLEALEEGQVGGEPIAVAVCGDPGTGKSRLASAVRASLQVADRAVWVGQADGLPYGVFRQICSQAADTLRRARPGADVAPESVAPLLAPFAPLPHADGPAGRARLQAGVAGLLGAAGEACGGAVVIVDGAELLDRESQDLVALLRRDAACRRLCWVIAGTAPAAGADLVIDLPALSPADTAEMLAGMLGTGDVPDVLPGALHEVAAANPRQMTRLVSRLVARGLLARSAGRWDLAPGALADLAAGPREVPAGGSAALPGDALDLLDLAAATYRPIRLDVLGAALGWDEGRLAGALDSLVRAKVARRAGARVAIDGDVRDATMPAPARLPRIRALAAALAALPDPLAPEDAEALWELARDAGLPEAARRAGIAAGLRRLALFSAEGAAGIFAGVLALPGEAPPGDQLAALRGLGDSLRLAGRAAEAVEPYQEAISLSRRIPPEDGAAAPLADLLVSLGKVWQTRSRYDEARSAFDEAVRLAGAEGLHGERARALAASARVQYFLGDAAGALDAARTAVAAAREAADEAQEAVALTFEGFLLCSRPAPERDEGLAVLGQAIEIAERRGDRYTLNLAHSYLGNAAMAVGDLPAARAAFAQNRRICRAIGARDEESFAILNLAVVALESGDSAEACALANEAATWAREADRRFPLAMARAIQGAAAQETGGGGLPLLEEALALAASLANAHLEAEVLALAIRADLAAGRLEEAGERIGRLAALGQAEQADKLALLRGIWLGRQGRDGEARAALGSAVASENRLVARQALLEAAAVLDLSVRPAAGEQEVTRGSDLARACAEFAGRASSDGPEDLLERLGEAALSLAGAERALILRYEEGRLVTRLARGAPGDWAYSATVAKRVLWSGESLRSADVLTDERFAGSRSVAGMPSRAVLCVPLATTDRALGVLYLDRPAIAGPFAEGAGAAVEALATISAVQLANSDRARDLLRERDVATELCELALAALPAGEPDAALRLGLGAALRLIPAERAIAVEIYPDGEPAVRVALDRGGNDLPAAAAGISTSIARWVAETGEATAILDATGDETWGAQQSVPALDLRAVVCAPWRRAGQVAGLLWLDARDPAFQPGDREAGVLARVTAVLEARLARA